MKQLFRRLHYLLNRDRLDGELADEMAVHREMATGRDGAPFGNTLRLREEARDAWGWTWIDRLGQDLRYAARMLCHAPGFTAAAVLMLALGIGANIAAFGFFNLMVLRPLPVRDPDTLLQFQRRGAQSYAAALPYPEMAFFREHTKTLAAVLALNVTRLTIDGDDKPLNAHFVTANLFDELGAAAARGRMLNAAEDEAPGAGAVVVLSHGYWQRRFGADPLVVGKTVRLNGKPATIVGVAPPQFSGLSLDQPDLWAPMSQQPYFVAGSRLLTDFAGDGAGVKMWGRLLPGLTPRAAEDELRTLAAALRSAHPKEIWEDERLPSEPGGYASSLTSGNRRGTGTPPSGELYPIFGMVGALVVLILVAACGNLGSLLLARSVAREREIAIRVAVGAGRGRLLRQLFTESLLLALLGSVAGLAVGYLVLRSLMTLTETPAWLDPAPDWRVIVFAIGLAFVAAILFGLTPALQVARQRPRATRIRQYLIGGQVAASCVLLIVAGLLVRAVSRAASVSPGFEYQQVASIDPDLVSHGFSAAGAGEYLATLESRLRGLPGVEAVSLASTTPLGRKVVVMRTQMGDRATLVHMNSIEPQFFQTMRIPLLRGRTFVPGETRALIVSQSLALRAWPGEDALGKGFPMGTDEAGVPVSFTVIGVAGSARAVGQQDPDSVEAYSPFTEADLPSMVVLVKTSGAPEGLVPFMASVARGVDPRVSPDVQLLKASFRRKLQGTEYSASAVGLLGLTALALAAFGIVGLVAYAVSQRTREIGIRMALGAVPTHVIWVLLRQFAGPIAAGLLVGVGGAAALSQILRGQLYGIGGLDPVAYLSAIGLFVATVALSALLPARRALRVDPMLALRHE
jgi:predicted permease